METVPPTEAAGRGDPSVMAAVADLSVRLGVAPDEIEVAGVDQVT